MKGSLKGPPHFSDYQYGFSDDSAIGKSLIIDFNNPDYGRNGWMARAGLGEGREQSV
jgi:hypothetical protein